MCARAGHRAWPFFHSQMSSLRFLLLLTASLLPALPEDAAFTHAVQLHRSGDRDGAIREYQAVLAADPNRVDARSNLGAVFAKLGRYQEAIDAYQLALKTAPPDAAPFLRLNLGLAYYKSFQIPKAAEILTVLHQEQPDNLNATLLLADCHLRMGGFKQVIELLDPIEAAQPANRGITYLLGMAYLRDGQVSKGQQRVNLILRDGESAEGRFLLAMGMFVGGDYPAAVKVFSRAIELNPNVPSLQSFYGQALLNTGDADAAAKAFRSELAANPNDFDANFQLAAILSNRRQLAEALPLLERAVQVRPASTAARAALPKAKSGEVDVAITPGGVAVGSPAPDFSLPRRDSSERIHLAQFRGDKPVVLVFGSYTCPK